MFLFAMQGPSFNSKASEVRFDADHLIVHLSDGTVVEVPTSWFPRLAEATEEQRAQYQLVSQGVGIHWPTVEQDISVDALLERMMRGDAMAHAPHS